MCLIHTMYNTMSRNSSLKGIILFFCLSIGSFSFSQSIDSLKLDTLIEVLTYQKNDIRTVDAYNELSAEYLRVGDYFIALAYSELAIDMADDIGYRNAEFEATCSVAYIYMAYLLDFEKSLKYYEKALDLALISKSNEELIKVYRGISSVFSGVLNFEAALMYNQKAIEIAAGTDDNSLMSDLKAYEGSIYEDLGDTTSAISSYKEVLQIEEDNNFENTSMASMTCIARYHYLMSDLSTSLKYYRIALKKFQRNHDNRWVAYIHSQMATVYLAEGSIIRAEKHGMAGLNIATEFQLNKERR